MAVSAAVTVSSTAGSFWKSQTLAYRHSDVLKANTSKLEEVWIHNVKNISDVFECGKQTEYLKHFLMYDFNTKSTNSFMGGDEMLYFMIYLLFVGHAVLFRSLTGELGNPNPYVELAKETNKINKAIHS